MGCEVTYEADAIAVQGRPLRGIDVDMNAISDTVQTLCAVAIFADGPTNIRGVDHIRHKETDRIRALVTELRKLGVEVQQTARRPADRAPTGNASRRHDRYIRRSPHGHEHGAVGFEYPGRAHQ